MNKLQRLVLRAIRSPQCKEDCKSCKAFMIEFNKELERVLKERNHD